MATAAAASARASILAAQDERLNWWYRDSCGGAASPLRGADFDSVIDDTLCALSGRASKGFALTSMLLVRNDDSNQLRAALLVDQSDKHINDAAPINWPARSLAQLQQLAALQEAIARGALPPLPPFTALLSSLDYPLQRLDSGSWCGLAPLLSNAAVRGVHADLLMPDYSFSPVAYLPNALVPPNASVAALPRGWTIERDSLWRRGAATPYAKRRREVFWRGGASSNAARRPLLAAVVRAAANASAAMRANVRACERGHCEAGEGATLAEWCDRKLLLVLPGNTFKVGHKYALLCRSLVVVLGEAARGAATAAAVDDAAAANRAAGEGKPADGSSAPPPLQPEYEQWWEAGLRDGVHLVRAATPADVPLRETAVGERWAAAVGARGAEYAYAALEPSFVLEYWHALFAGYAALFDGGGSSGGGGRRDGGAALRGPPNRHEQACASGSGRAVARGDLRPIPPAAALAEAIRSREAMEQLYRQFATVLPLRFAGVRRASDAEHGIAAVRAWLRKGPVGANSSAQEERLGH